MKVDLLSKSPDCSSAIYSEHCSLPKVLEASEDGKAADPASGSTLTAGECYRGTRAGPGGRPRTRRKAYAVAKKCSVPKLGALDGKRKLLAKRSYAHELGSSKSFPYRFRPPLLIQDCACSRSAQRSSLPAEPGGSPHLCRREEGENPAPAGSWSFHSVRSSLSVYDDGNRAHSFEQHESLDFVQHGELSRVPALGSRIEQHAILYVRQKQHALLYLDQH